MYAGVARKSLLVYYPIFRDPLPPLLNQRIWVEGIGNTYNPFDQADCLDGDCEYETALICLSANDTILYGNCVESCKIDSLTNNDEILVNHARWSVLPNPVALNQPITIRSTIQKSATGQLLITNVMGQIVFKQPFNLFENQALISISWSPTTAGMYWLIWQNEDGSQQMTPFIAH
ncbi:MAG: T9SS type A sorting domain-containing protein [Saprospiraceae bacterium]